MRKKKSVVLIFIIFLAIGFASISTVLYIGGTIAVKPNADEYDVYYSNAKVNGIVDHSVIKSDTSIVFSTEISTFDDIYELEYFITNGSRNYDSNVSMTCTDGNEYVTVTNDWINVTIIGATETKSGTLTLEMIKSYDQTDRLNLEIKCDITANAIEASTPGENIPDEKLNH